jgi:hypothetical protein
MIANQLSSDNQFSACTAQLFRKTIPLFAALLLWLIAVQAQPATDTHPGDPQARVIEGVSNTTVFGLGQSIRITGSVKEGAIAFGGDVIVEGTVDGDVAAIGGSVIQREGSRIGGDVIVLGGIYHHGKAAPGRDPQAVQPVAAPTEREVFRLSSSGRLALVHYFTGPDGGDAEYGQSRGRAAAINKFAGGTDWFTGRGGGYDWSGRLSAVNPGSDWRVDFSFSFAAGTGGHAFWTGRHFRRHRPLVAAPLSAALAL